MPSIDGEDYGNGEEHLTIVRDHISEQFIVFNVQAAFSYDECQPFPMDIGTQ